jgi:hypothetical protein
MDKSIHPGDDFFNYANGKWFLHHPIPKSESGYGIFTLVEDENKVINLEPKNLEPRNIEPKNLEPKNLEPKNTNSNFIIIQFLYRNLIITVLYYIHYKHFCL